MNRTQDPGAVERRLLDLAHTTDAKLTATALAYYAPCSIEEASAVLEDLAARNHLTMDVDDDGTVVYEMLGRQKLAPRTSAPAPLRAMIPGSRAERGASPVLAAILGLWIPGAGHLYAGRFVAAVLWFLVVGMGYVLFLPGLVLHLFSVASAATSARRINAAPSHRFLFAPVAA